MAAANPLWGAPRIHGELLKRGVEISERTVSRLLPRKRRPPSQTWKAFLESHVNELVSVDFFTVPTATFRVLFVLVVLGSPSAPRGSFHVTEHPTAAWTAQQVREAFPEDRAPRYLIRDRDGVYGDQFRDRVREMGMTEVPERPRLASIVIKNFSSRSAQVCSSRAFSPQSLRCRLGTVNIRLT